jgi:hypothetical protein
MALDGKAIKEEIPDKEVVYDSGNGRRIKDELSLKPLIIIKSDGQFLCVKERRKLSFNYQVGKMKCAHRLIIFPPINL